MAAGLVSGVVVVGVLAAWSAGRVESDLTGRTRTALDAAGLTVAVRLDGRDAVVGAGGGPAVDVWRAAAVVAAVPGIQGVRVDPASAAAAPQPPAGGTASPSPTPSAGPTGEPERKPDLVLRFGSDDAELGTVERGELDELVTKLENEPGLRVRVAGHADGSGRESANRKLSRDRANAVRDHLVAAGIAARRVTTEAYGDTRPVAGNDTARDRSLNRRVEIVLQEGS